MAKPLRGVKTAVNTTRRLRAGTWRIYNCDFYYTSVFSFNILLQHTFKHCPVFIAFIHLKYLYTTIDMRTLFFNIIMHCVLLKLLTLLCH